MVKQLNTTHTTLDFSPDLSPQLTMEESFQDFKPALATSEALTEANRCLYCYDAPCIKACPTEINIPQFIGRISAENNRGAAKTILDANIMGLSCASACPTEVLCEGACVYNALNHKPIMIGKLQRFAVEKAYQEGAKFYSPGAPTGKKIALIGAGPASLACAHELRKLGHETVIYEKTSLPGGLNTHGIAPYKMKSSVSLTEIQQISAVGVEFKFENELGKNLELTELLEKFDAVFLGIGLGADSFPKISGSDSPEIFGRVRGATELIAEIKTAPLSQVKWLKTIHTALVIGGGNTALDACRELKGLGIPNVIGSYRRGETEMSGYAHELKAARQEGVEFKFHTLPIEFKALEAEPGSTPLLQVKLLKTNSSLEDQIKLQNAPPIDESLQLSVGLVVVATGQSKLEKLLSKIPGLQFDRGRLLADAKTGITGNSKIYAGGDLTNGGKEVVNAVAEGKRAAIAMNQQLRS